MAQFLEKGIFFPSVGGYTIRVATRHARAPIIVNGLSVERQPPLGPQQGHNLPPALSFSSPQTDPYLHVVDQACVVSAERFLPHNGKE